MIDPTPIGLLVPSSNTVLEPVAQALAATAQSPAITLHVTRVRVLQIGLDARSRAQFEPTAMAAAAGLLADAGVQATAWGGVSGAWLGEDHDAEIIKCVEDATAAPATTAARALLVACRALGARRIGLVTPYTAEVVDQIRATYAAAGLEVVAEAHEDITENHAFATVTEERIRAQVRRTMRRPVELDTLVVACTNLRGAGVVVDLEDELGVPVIDSAAATLWHAALIAGRPLELPGAGALLDTGALRLTLVDACERLREATGAARTTVRLDIPDRGLDVHWVAAEAVAPGARPIGRDRSIRQWELPTVQRVKATLQPLVQEHAGVDPGIPEALQIHYGARAQMLLPIVRHGELGGLLSVHSGVERAWRDHDIAVAQDTARAISEQLGWVPDREQTDRSTQGATAC